MAALRKTVKLTAERARQLFSYDPISGEITRLVSANNAPKGSIIKRSRITVRIENETIIVARLAWLLFYGEWPKNLVDHKNRNRTDNAIINLRDATHTENQYNKVSPNPHGYKGVTWRNRIDKPWLSKIRVNGKRINLGSFRTKEEAAKAYEDACVKYHGEFANLGVS